MDKCHTRNDYSKDNEYIYIATSKAPPHKSTILSSAPVLSYLLLSFSVSHFSLSSFYAAPRTIFLIEITLK